MTASRAAVLVAQGRPIELLDLEVADPGPGQVLVALRYSGICQSQLNEVTGRRGPDAFLPHTLGHEGSGTVMAVGDGVTKVVPGDRVVLTWIRGSGLDSGGATYRGADGPVNGGPVSTLMTVTLVSENRLVPLTADVPDDVVALLGCALPTGAGIVMHQLGDVRGAVVVVVGVGGVGASAVLAARALGAAAVIAVDVSPTRLEQARAMGATAGVDAASSDPVAGVLALTDGAGADYVVESAGRVEAMESAFAMTRVGGACVLAGNVEAGGRISVDPFDLIRGKRLSGSWGGASDPDEDIPALAARIADGTFDVTAMRAAVYELADVNIAFDDLAAGRVLRPLVALGSGSSDVSGSR